jgi:hypothetical protein
MHELPRVARMTFLPLPAAVDPQSHTQSELPLLAAGVVAKNKEIGKAAES